MIITVENIAVNDVLGAKFTAYGSFSVAFIIAKSGDKVDYEEPKDKDGRRLMPTVTCELRRMSDNGLHATGVPAVNASSGRWQADFTNVPAGTKLKLVYSISDGVSAPVFGANITNLSVKALLEVNSSTVPAPTGAPGSTRSFAPVGDFKVDPLRVTEFKSVIVVQGEPLSTLSLGALRVFHVAQTWELRFTHTFFHDVGLTASHVIRLKTDDGTVRVTSRPGL